MSLELTWLGHASFKLKACGIVVYIDPWKLQSPQRDADVIFVSHDHFDHYSLDDINLISKESTVIYAPDSTAKQLAGAANPVKPGDQFSTFGAKLKIIPAYNIGKEFHPKANNWCGVIVEICGKTVYYAGDTDRIPEMQELGELDLALLPVGGTYTLDAPEAAEACKDINPTAALPYHWGDIVGSSADAQEFEKLAPCPVKLITPGQTIEL